MVTSRAAAVVRVVIVRVVIVQVVAVAVVLPVVVVAAVRGVVVATHADTCALGSTCGPWSVPSPPSGSSGLGPWFPSSVIF